LLQRASERATGVRVLSVTDVNRSKLAAIAALVLLFAPFVSEAQTATAAPLIIEDLQCRGNTATACSFILKYLYLERGDSLDEDEVRNAQLRLSTLHMFESVDIFLEKGSERGKTIVVIDVVETNPLSAEWLVGMSSRLGSLRGVTAGRLTDDNLFGKRKFADLTASTQQPLDGPVQRGKAVTLRYVDPHLFDSRRYFGALSAKYFDSEFKDRYNNFDDATIVTLGAAVGSRLWDFSYLTFDYGYLVRLDEHWGFWQPDGSFKLDSARNRHAVNVNYGWNSEDDFYFPTKGSSFRTGVGLSLGSSQTASVHYSFRKTWSLGDGFVSIKLGENPSSDYRQNLTENQLLTTSYGRAVRPGDFVQRGRWYIEAGFSPRGYKENGRSVDEFGLKVGVRLETSTLGLVDLYLLGTEEPGR
jgi:outer membrane protein assembly factor BamA